MDVVFNSSNIALTSGTYLIMDNDSGYVSNNLDQESNSDSVTEALNNSSVDILKSLLPKSLYFSEDALLERPDIDQNISVPREDENIQDFPDMPNDELSNIVLNTAKTAGDYSFLPSFSGAQSDSGSSAHSVVVPIASPIYYDLNTKVKSIPLLNEDTNIGSNVSDGPFFGYENVPMNGTNQVFQNTDFDIFANKYIPSEEKVNLFSEFFANKPNTCNVGETTTVSLDSAIPNKDCNTILEEQAPVEIIQETITPIEESSSFIGKSSKPAQEESAIKIGNTSISSINIEELPILVEGYPDILLPTETSGEPPTLIVGESMATFEERKERKERKQFTPPIIESPLNCNQLINIVEESSQVNKSSTNEGQTGGEIIVLNNVTNTTVCFNNGPSTSKITNFPRRNSTKNKENLAQPEVFKTPNKCRKRKFSELGSPDLFSDEESSHRRSSISPKVIEERFVHKLDHKLIHRIQETIRGVPPPPDFTVTKLTVNDILEKLDANKSFFWTNEEMKKVKEQNAEKEKASLNGSHNSSFGCSGSILIEGQHEEAINKQFPEILNSRHHGLHFNRSKLSEEIEHLCDKYASRFIGAETQSTCNSLATQYMMPNRRKVKWAAKSPGRRLSHLARRRITFPSGSLQASSSSSAASRARQILIDCKKLELLNHKKSPKKMPKKTPIKSPTVSPSSGRTPSSSAKKKLRMRFRLLSGDLNEMGQRSAVSNSKRALFQSPDKDCRFRNMLSSSSSSINPTSFNGDLNTCTAKRSLFPSPNKAKCRTSLFSSPGKKSLFKNVNPFEKKRKRDDDDENISNQAKFFRSQSSCGIPDRETKAESLLARTKSESVLTHSQSMSDLSAANKKKLQWAVYESLKLQNISVTHPQFKIFASVLARVSRRCLFSSGVKLEGSGTSEKMLRIAKRHSYAVVKGKSVEEIMSEFNKSKAKTKPQGYVAPHDYNPFVNKESSSNKEQAFKDRDSNGGDSISKSSSSQLAILKPESRIDRIRKVINFEDNR